MKDSFNCLQIYKLLFFCVFFSLTAFSLPVGAEEVSWRSADEILARIAAPVFPEKIFDVSSFGAKGDGKTDCTQAFADAINRCSETGGGKVVVPAGEFVTGPIHLKSNVNLVIEKNAIVKFSTDHKKYLPAVFTRWEGVELMGYSALIYAYEQTNIAVTGEGILDGQGSNESWWPWSGKDIYGWEKGNPNQRPARDSLLRMAENNIPVEKRIFGDGSYLRPNFFQPYKCTNILVSGVTFKNSPMWFLHPVLCSNVTVRNVTTVGHGPNNDGCDPESSRDILIEGCTFDNGDDCIAIKSGRNADGRRLNTPSENIIIRKCTMKDGHGGVVLGSEISGSVRNVFVEDCTMDSPNLDRALRFKTNSMRGGTIENIFVRRVMVGQVAEAIVLVDYNYEEGDKGSFTPVMRNLHISDMTAKKGKYGFFIKGYARSPISNLTFERCSFNGIEAGNVLQYVSDMVCRDVTINGKEFKPEVTVPWSDRLAENFLALYPDSIVYSNEGKPGKWNYEQGLILEAFYQMFLHTKIDSYKQYIKKNLDMYVRDDGSIRTYKLTDFNIDNIAPGKSLLRAYDLFKDEKYKKAADTLRRQLSLHPRTVEGGFWHKKIYPNQMWLDGLYMAEPFYTLYSLTAKDPDAFSDIAKQFLLIAKNAADPKTGLLFHAWDEKKEQRWADTETGCSPNLWGRSLGWYAMALVDVLDYFPQEHPQRKELEKLFKKFMENILKQREDDSKLWYQVINRQGAEGNYREASASAMFTYAFAKGFNKKLLPSSFGKAAKESFAGIVKNLVKIDSGGIILLNDNCSVAGLGGNPYRDGSYQYYINEPRRVNDFKGYGPFLLAAVEIERMKE